MREVGGILTKEIYVFCSDENMALHVAEVTAMC